ncbi:MAG: hypothetical protein OXD31_13150 [Chloroflexi bacterium]|nr:hypothetical protein [Chloroflexota bacterium]
MPTAHPPPDRQVELLDLHNRLLSHDPVATEELFTIVAPELEKHLRAWFPGLAVGVDPDIYLSAVYEALTDYFKNPSKYDPTRSGLMTYLRLACRRDMQNLLARESRHAAGRISLESVEFSLSDGNDVSERVADSLDSKRLVADLTRGMTSEERAVFSLMMEGERSTRVAAEAMNIGHLVYEEQAKRVKRVKDRIKKRMRRRGLLRS